MEKYHKDSVTERLLRAYKLSITMLLVLFLYIIIAGFTTLIGISLTLSAMKNNSSIMILLGGMISIVGYLLVITSVFASFLYSATRGEGYSKQLGIFEAYIETFKLILELSLSLIVGAISLSIAFYMSGILSVIFYIIAFIIFLLFPLASLFYIVEYLKTL